ncbi:MAG: AI-2E family transporter [Clostridia bacterium]|nr:AI-2E family transporter [Clostridia bacterium]
MRVYVRAAAAFAASWLLTTRLGWLVAPVVVGLFLAAAIEPLVARLEAWGLPRAQAAPSAFAVGVLALGLLAALAFRLGVAELAQLVSDLPGWYGRLETVAGGWLLRLSESSQGLPAWLLAELPHALGPAVSWAERAGEALLAAAEGLVLSGFSRLLLALFVGGLLGFFLSKDASALRATLARGLPPGWRPAARHAGERAVSLARSLLLASLGSACLTFAFVSLALWLLGAPMPVLAGFVAALLDLLPLFGPGLLLLPWSAVLLVLGNGAGALAILAVWLGAGALRLWFAARIATDDLRVHPAIVVYALYAGVLFLGPAGLVAVPLAIVFIRTLEEMGALRWE